MSINYHFNWFGDNDKSSYLTQQLVSETLKKIREIRTFSLTDCSTAETKKKAKKTYFEFIEL